jgi:hypothetical protein
MSKSQLSAAGRVAIFLFHSTAPMISPQPAIICRTVGTGGVAVSVIVDDVHFLFQSMLLLRKVILLVWKSCFSLGIRQISPYSSHTLGPHRKKESMSEFGGNNHRFISGTLTQTGSAGKFYDV